MSRFVFLDMFLKALKVEFVSPSLWDLESNLCATLREHHTPNLVHLLTLMKEKILKLYKTEI
jgi:hypothetical protein